MHLSLSSTGRVTHALLIVLVTTAAPAGAQTAADLFNDRVLHTLSLTVHTRDWDLLRTNYTVNDYYPADVTWNGVRVRNVGIRSRGYGSRTPVKPGLNLDFDRYTTNGQFLGLRSLVLDNLFTDASMIRERVAMSFMRRLGIPAPRESFAKVFVNGEYMGLYAMVEVVDPVFVQRTLGDGAGALFEYRWVGEYYGDDLGDELEAYQALFEPRSRKHDSIVALYGPIQDLFEAIHEAPDDAFEETVGALLDLDATLRLVAAETVLAEIDGVLGFAGMNNFYLHRHSATGVHRMVPWDKDHSFFQWDYPLMTGTAENALMRRVLADPELRAQYTAYLLEAVSVATADDWLEQEVGRTYEQVRQAALEDDLKQFTDDEFEATVATLIDFARTRPGFVVEEVERHLVGP